MRHNDFSRKVKEAARVRATKGGVLYCEGEGCGLPIKKCRVDHIIAAGLNGPATLENAQVLGPCCWPLKDSTDNRVVKRVSKIAVRHLNIEKPRSTLRSRGFEKRVKPPRPKSAKILPYRPLGRSE